LSLFGIRYTGRLFTDHELACCGTNPTTIASGLAARFAAKEAVLKIFDTREFVPSWKVIEVRRTLGGRPEICLHGDAAELAKIQGITEMSVSLSHSGGIATAAVVANIREPRAKKSR
jgi:holo-[acyl-carrier protein] synthase